MEKLFFYEARKDTGYAPEKGIGGEKRQWAPNTQKRKGSGYLWVAARFSRYGPVKYFSTQMNHVRFIISSAPSHKPLAKGP